MAKKKEDQTGLKELFIIFSYIISILFIINTLIVYFYHSHKYDIKSADYRVTDTGNILRFIVPMTGWISMIFGLIFFIFLFFSNPENNIYVKFYHPILITVFIVGLIGCLAISARLGTTQIGMLIFKKKGIFVIPSDHNSNNFVDNIFKLKIIANMFTMEELNIADVKKITRESGKIAYIHGNFGTRQVSWRNKQKRDECIAILENVCKRHLSSF